MNKKGLTLIELLAVLAILAVIAGITVPIVFKNINKAKKTLYLEQISEIENSAQNWAADNVSDLPTEVGKDIKVYLPVLKTEGYIDNDIISNKTGEQFSDTSYVQITCTVAGVNYNYKYEYIE